MTKPVDLSMIVAATEDGGIGVDGDLPWSLRRDMRYFQDITTSYNRGSGINKVIMGRNTWESIPEKFRPLRNRMNIVLSRTHSESEIPGCRVFRSLELALEWIHSESPSGQLFVIGGAQLYNHVMQLPYLCKIFLTRVFPPKPLRITTRINAIPEKFVPVKDEAVPEGTFEENGFKFEFLLLLRPNQ